MWSIEFDPSTCLMTLRLVHFATPSQMRALARAHVHALSATGASSFRVLADLRGARPFEREAATIFAEIRRSALAAPGFRRRAVLTDSPIVAMQQRRDILDDAIVSKHEIVTLDESEARNFLGRTF